MNGVIDKKMSMQVNYQTKGLLPGMKSSKPSHKKAPWDTIGGELSLASNSSTSQVVTHSSLPAGWGRGLEDQMQEKNLMGQGKNSRISKVEKP